METPVLTYIFSTLSAVGIAAFGAYKVRKKTKSEVALNLATVEKTKAETEKFVIDTMRGALEELRMERADDRQKIDRNESTIKLLEAANDECEFEHGLTRLQLEKALHKLELLHWQKASVFVLDDSEVVVNVFTKWFERMPVVYFKAYSIPELFVEDVNREDPEILIIDMMLGGITALDIIKQLKRSPLILIMSATKEYEERFKDTEYLFFYKDRYYIRNISRAILMHLRNKNLNT